MAIDQKKKKKEIKKWNNEIISYIHQAKAVKEYTAEC